MNRSIIWLLALALVTPVYAATLDDLSWMAGHWAKRADGASSEEVWTAPALDVTDGAGPGRVEWGFPECRDIGAAYDANADGIVGCSELPDCGGPLDLLSPVLLAVHDLAENQESDELLGPSSVVATMVDVLPQSRNVIPDSAVVTIDWRILPGSDDEMLMDRVREAIVESTGGRLSNDQEAFRRAWLGSQQ